MTETMEEKIETKPEVTPQEKIEGTSLHSSKREDEFIFPSIKEEPEEVSPSPIPPRPVPRYSLRSKGDEKIMSEAPTN